MENITMIPMTDVNALALTASACATSALATLAVQGIAVRPAAAWAVEGTRVPFADVYAVAAIAADVQSVKRDRAGEMGHRGFTTAVVPGSPAWSHPN
ncbi:hypothetical protein [Nocardioides sp. J54]|uniref:hypothetical protein n=1 Tax=Nocardioides sp. J54 TaxID=935866 RepID=UPI0004AE5591|nr:hypothetical protein [Nocardioides sp. J54]